MRFLLLTAATAAILAGCEMDAEISTGGDAPDVVEAPAAPVVPDAPDARNLPQALQDGTITPAVAVQAYLDRIEALDDQGPMIQAVITTNPEALSQAEQMAAKDIARGPLFGLPILVKDNIETIEMPTTAGSLALIDNDTGRDAPAVASLKAAGAIILGKANLSEWANFRSSESTSGWSAVGGLSRNPHDITRNTCGSSAGSGAAVAAGFAWAALGTETNGSVICPSAANGIVGFKPTVGLVSRSLVVPISPSQDTIGPMTTSVRDAAMVLSAMAGTDPTDEATAEADSYAIDFAAALEGASLEGVRLGVMRFAQSGDPKERAVFDEALARAEEAGAVLVDIEELGDLGIGSGKTYLVLKAEFKDSLNAYLANAAPAVETRTLEDVIAFNEGNERETSLFGQDILIDSQATEGTAGDDYLEAVASAQRGTRENGVDRLLTENGVDFLVAPSFGPAHRTDLIRGDIIASNAGAGWLAAIAGYPHLTVPMGDVSGLPLGLSIMSTKWKDAEVLQVGQAFEDVLPPRLEPTFRNGDTDLASIAAAAKTLP